jgi:xanthine dehydrogenase accessory factor
MTLDAARAAALALDGAEHGAGSASFLTLEGPGRGARLLLMVAADGSEAVHGTLGAPALDTAALEAGRRALDDPRHTDGTLLLDGGASVAAGGASGLAGGARAPADEVEVYLEIRRPVQDLVIVGAGHIALPMARTGSDLGYRVWVLDDRPDFATRERFPDAYRVVRADFSDPFRDVPLHRGTHVLLVTRGHKYDYDCLVRVLRADPAPAYIGMIGSRRRVRATFVQLLDDGIPRSRLDVIHAPVGLDIGAETPEEIAVAVAAELVLARRGGTGTPLHALERVAERFFNEERDG